ncbi:hypothetical protein, conserved [Plasmodium gonderi]|uniref:Uncharacterized protein n=1 Tax=Plasmodium gonderi TaxID=77519 RepID=A0A1Y1JKV5_PLAGO|nr:hypothetical protein, conserved [Plasmodium gonderi]GAW83061.1 hypothetical protein, conserved [Plasmodium gonderi]
MLRNTGKFPNNTFEEDKVKEKTIIYNRRIDKEIKNLKESKLIHDKNVYITINQVNQANQADVVEENNNHILLEHNSVGTKWNKYLCLLESFNEKYFQSDTFFLRNFVNNVKNLKKKINTRSYMTNDDVISPTVLEELNKYNRYANVVCPFFDIYEILNFGSIFDNFSDFLNEICYFLENFEIFKNGFMKEQRVFGNLSENNETENDPFDSHENSKFSFFTNTFFEIIYKDFTIHLRNIQREVINKVLYSNDYEEESFYETFSLFFHRYYSINESVVFSFFIFDDYPFSKPYVNIDHVPFCLLRKKNQRKLKGDKYNKRNVISILLHEEKGWVPKITIVNLFEGSQNFVHKLFFYYQYKIYLFYYYLNKHKIFERFFENNCKVNFETYPLVYAYVATVDKKLATQKVKRKKNYSNLLYSINNCEFINQNILLYKFFYTYKKLKRKNYYPGNVEKITSSIQQIIQIKKKKYEYYIYLFFLLFIFFLPQFIKNVYIYHSEEIQNYLTYVGKNGFAQFGNLKDDDARTVRTHPLFYVYVERLSRFNFAQMSKGRNAFDTASIPDEEPNFHGDKEKRVNKKLGKEEKGQLGKDAVENRIKSSKDMMKEMESSAPSTTSDALSRKGEWSNSEKTKNDKIDNNLIITQKKKSAERGIEKNARINILTIVLLAITEFLVFTLGVIYNLHLLKKRMNHNNFVVNICSSMLILYNPLFYSNNTNYVTVFSLGLLFWTLNFILLKRMYISLVVYFIATYFDTRNLSFFFPILFIYTYTNSRYVIRKGNKVKSIFKNWYDVVKHVLLYTLTFFMISLFFFYTFSEEQIPWITIIKRCLHFISEHFEALGQSFIKNNNGSFYSSSDTKTMTGGNESRNMGGSYSNIVENISYRYIFFPCYIPHILIILFNYLIVVNTIAKLYCSLMFSSIVFFFMSWGNHYCCNYFLTVLLILLFLFINVVRSSSILLNIIFTSYIIITSDSFNIYLFSLTIFYFLFHFYLMFPSHNFLLNINYHAYICFKLIKQVCSYVLCNMVYLYETSIKNIVLSFVVMLFSSSSSSVITPPDENYTRDILQRKEIQLKIILCLYSHLPRDFLHIPVTLFTFVLFILLGFLRVHAQRRYPKIALHSLKLLTVITLLTILLLFYTKRKKFKKLDFLSTPESACKRTFPLERSKKL